MSLYSFMSCLYFLFLRLLSASLVFGTEVWGKWVFLRGISSECFRMLCLLGFIKMEPVMLMLPVRAIYGCVHCVCCSHFQ